MDEFSVFKSSDKTKTNGHQLSLFVPHISLFNKVKRSSVAELIALNERYYDTSRRTSDPVPVASGHEEDQSVESRKKNSEFMRRNHVNSRSNNHNNNKSKNISHKHDRMPVEFKRKRIKDIDLRFTNTGLMSYCEYLRGESSPE
mmetsp:Transcript_23477/g.39838  ORF Transcript_23477/g.39838 Transcript_23477/m.39838 type:complete len:144 (-) Transcript_23477:431-862(-)